MAAYGLKGDTFRFYEINPLVTDASRRYFTFLTDSHAQLEMINGDGRIVLEQELRSGGSHDFDILVIDAFTSDSIPIHLLTRESAQLYLHHLHPDGILLFHITNRFLDLNPVIRGLAGEYDCHAVRLNAKEDLQLGRTPSHWVAVTRNLSLAHYLEKLPAAESWREDERQPVLFTDDFSSLFRVIM